MKKIVFFTGAGVSAESGIKTFRDSDGLWENHSIEEVASPDGFRKNPKLVLEFYNIRRRQMYQVKPNRAHTLIGELQEYHDVYVITQNIDNLHERGGSKKVLHLHGELDKARGVKDDRKLYPLDGKDINIGDLAPDGTQLRPHVVWFGEMVPAMEEAVEIVSQADTLIIIGTSLLVYPAASLINYIKDGCDVFYIDPKAQVPYGYQKEMTTINKNATEGVEELFKLLISD
ncbi:NAD-dependent deacylase [bacterium]|nr:NAD-dependent deacylase [bacterium]